MDEDVNIPKEQAERLERIRALVKHLNGDTLNVPKGNFKRQAMDDPNRTQMKGSRKPNELTEEEEQWLIEHTNM